MHTDLHVVCERRNRTTTAKLERRQSWWEGGELEKGMRSKDRSRMSGLEVRAAIWQMHAEPSRQGHCLKPTGEGGGMIQSHCESFW